MDQENVYQALQKSDWKTILDWLYANRTSIKTDPLLNQAATTFAQEFLRQLPTYDVGRADVLEHLVTMLQLHRGRLYQFSPDHYKLLIVNLAVRTRADGEQALIYAREFPEEEECRRILQAHAQQQPQQVRHSQSESIQITTQPETLKIAERDLRISLFKSNQELQFFHSLQHVFPSYLLYPNVAISCLIDYNSLQTELTAEESKLFFTGLIDLVLFDQAKGYLPVYFFELDSVWHDTRDAQRRDKVKDTLFAKAGLELTRIRKLDKDVDEQQFTRMIRELLQSPV